MTAALLTSLVLALTWTPGLSYVVLLRETRRRDQMKQKRAPPRRPRAAADAACSSVHRRVLEWALAKPLWLAASACCSWSAPGPATRRSAPTCCRRWTRAASSSTTSCPPAARSPRPTASSQHVERILHVTSRSRKHLAPHRPADGPGRRHRGQHRRLHREAQGEAQPRCRRRDGRRARADQSHRAGARHRVHPGAAGHDRRSLQCPRADPDQDLLRRPAAAQPARSPGRRRHRKIPGVVDVENGIDNTISGPATNFQVDPGCRRGSASLRPKSPKMRPRFSTALPPPIRSLPTAAPTPSACASATSIAARSTPSRTPSSTAPQATPRRWARWPTSSSCRRKTRFAAKTCNSSSS